MNKFLLIFLFAWTYINADAQESYTVTGKVIDQNNRPLGYASVYINNSQYQTMADKDGAFTLQLQKPGIYDVVASMVGYTSNDVRTEIKSSSVQISVRLFQKIHNLKDVTIGEDDNNRQRYMELFKRYFLGSSKNGRSCKILNPNVLHFFYNNAAKELDVQADDILDIENKALGYKIKYSLSSFKLNVQSFYMNYYGYMYYDNSFGNDKQKAQWANNRRETYKGSTRQFFRSLFNDSLGKNGFTVYRVQQLNTANAPDRKEINEKIQFYSDVVKYEMRVQPSSGHFLSENKNLFGDSLLRYNLLRKYVGTGVSFYYHDSVPLSLFRYMMSAGPERKYLNYPQRFWIENVLTEEEEYRNTTNYIWEKFAGNNRQKTVVTVLNPANSYISADGSVLPQTFYYEGYFAWKGIGDELPSNYSDK